MPFTKEEEAFLTEQENNMKALQSEKGYLQSQANQQAVAVQEEQVSMIREQLDLSDELNTIEHLLRGEILKTDAQGNRDWAEPDDPSMKILTEHGIYLIMNTIMFYINKNTLLSNYDIDTINDKMEDFATDLTDTIFMEYEKVFLYPTFEECKTALKARIDKKTELRKFAYELVGREVNEVEIKEFFIKELEGRIEKEIEKIREQVIKNKLKRFLIIIREVQDAVHSTYLRAYAGQERKTLRQHIHISENRNPNPVPYKRPNKLNILNYGQ